MFCLNFNLLHFSLAYLFLLSLKINAGKVPRSRLCSVKGQNCFCERRDGDHASGRGIVKLIYPVERGYVLDVLWQ